MNVNSDQDALMGYDPATGAAFPYPSHAGQWREFHGSTAWLYNPWTGQPRRAEDVGSDVFGHLIVPPSRVKEAAEVEALSKPPFVDWPKSGLAPARVQLDPWWRHPYLWLD